MKKRLIGSIVGIALIAIGIYLWTNQSEKAVVELKDDYFIVEFGYSYSYDKNHYINAPEDIIDDVKIYINGEDIDYPIEYDITMEAWLEIYAVGQYDGVVIYKNKELKFIIEIKDTTSPEFYNFAEEITIGINEENVVYENYYFVMEHSKYTIVVDSSNVDITKAGIYEIVVMAEDIYGNATTRNAKVIVE
jgi:hypothetical protein